MDITSAIAQFKEKVVNPLCEDIRRTLEVTCYSSGPNNDGSNFLGNMVVLTGIETVARFTNPKTKEELSKFKKEAQGRYDSLDSDSKSLLLPRYEPDDVSGSRLAITFMKKISMTGSLPNEWMGKY